MRDLAAVNGNATWASEFGQKNAQPAIDGSQSAILGQIDRITIMSSMVITKGALPMMTSSIRPRLRRPCTTYKLMPTGGVIIASSIRIIMIIPNQTGSKPALNMMGAMMGTVATIIDNVSMNIPKMK